MDNKTDLDADIDRQPYRFNDDLLLAEVDRKEAQRLFPAVFHALDHPELRSLFDRFDRPANAAKSKSRKFGLTAIGLAVFSLLATSAEPGLHELGPQFSQAIAVAAAAAGIAAVILGYFGIRFSKQKREWLEKRLMTERLRQFHFQSMVAHWPSVIESLRGDRQREEFFSKR
jgi:hypothetical protein